MIRAHVKTWLTIAAFFLFGSFLRIHSQDSLSSLTNSGQATVDGHSAPYLIRHLPVSSFPQIPAAIQTELNRRGCLIPQTYEAHQPENVIHASFERPASSDWALLCSVNGSVSLLVFFGDGNAGPATLATAPETSRLQQHGVDKVLGFNWAIDPALPDAIHQAQLGMRRPPARTDHAAIADSILEQKTIYRFYIRNVWTILDTQD